MESVPAQLPFTQYLCEKVPILSSPSPAPCLLCTEIVCMCHTVMHTFDMLFLLPCCCISLKTLYPFLQIPACSTGPYKCLFFSSSLQTQCLHHSSNLSMFISMFIYICYYVRCSLLQFVKLMSTIKLAAQDRSESYT